MVELSSAERALAAIGFGVGMLAALFAMIAARRLVRVLRGEAQPRSILYPVMLAGAALFVGGGLMQVAIGRGDASIYLPIGVMNVAIGIGLVIAAQRRMFG